MGVKIQERLQKIISMAGVVSRRRAEILIQDGSVTVNGRVIRKLGSKADPAKDHIKVLGKLINPRQPKVYLALHKPRYVVSTMSDPEGRVTVKDFLRRVRARVYPVGRLDYDSEGLLLMTNDGDLVQRMLHPSFEIPKTYEVKVKGVLEERQLAALSKGVVIRDGRTLPCRVEKLKKSEKNSWLRITLHEGRNRQIRRMIEKMGGTVLRLRRTGVGMIQLESLPEGRIRYLGPQEVRLLKNFLELGSRTKVSKRKRGLQKLARPA